MSNIVSKFFIKYKMADIRHFELAYLISLFATLIDIIYQTRNVFAASFFYGNISYMI